MSKSHRNGAKSLAPGVSPLPGRGGGKGGKLGGKGHKITYGSGFPKTGRKQGPGKKHDNGKGR